MATTIDHTATAVNIHFVQGDTFRRRLFFYQLDVDGVTQIPEDVSTWTITAQIRRRASSTTAIDFSVDMTDAATGYVTISITDDDAATLAENNVWDLQRVLNGETKTLLAGTVTADREVTRPV